MTVLSELPTGTVTFIVAGLEDPARLLEEIGPASHAKLLARRDELLRAALAEHGGVEVEYEARVFVGVFGSAGAAVAAAAAAQRARASERWEPDGDPTSWAPPADRPAHG